jgi:hypothetical protein
MYVPKCFQTNITKEELIEKMKNKETIEEAAKRIYSDKEYSMYGEIRRHSFIAGAKWQQEQILDFLYEEITERRDYSASKMCEKVIEFIEQFKKK